MGSDWAIVACWGAGAVTGALLGFLQTAARPVGVGRAIAWWRARLWPFGSWLGLESVLYTIADAATVFILNGVLGTSAVGGLRAAQSLFAPLTLILPAITLPGLPAVARALASPGEAIRLAVTLSAVVGGLAALYVGVMILAAGQLVPYVFGSLFSEFVSLATPIGIWQLVAGLSAGFSIFLTAQQRGRDLVLIRVSGAVASLVFVSLLAWQSGVVGAAWGFSAAAGTMTALTIVLAIRSARRVDNETRRSGEPAVPVPEAVDEPVAE